MSVQKEPSGRRSVRVEVEVPGTPEQVWQAIATGPGVSAWFVKSEIEGRVGGKIACDFGGGMVSSTKITAWEPPRRFVAEDGQWLQGGPPVATEWTVEARAGGTCLVRVVHSCFASTDEWDNQLGSTETGWPGYFRVLKEYLQFHAGKPSAVLQAMAMTQSDVAAMRGTLLQALGCAAPAVGQTVRVQSKAGAAMSGTIAAVNETPEGYGLQLRLQQPMPGTALVGAFACSGMKMANLQVYFYGDGAADVAGREGPRWKQWLDGLFPQQTAGAS